MIIKDFIKYMENTQKLTITGGFDDYSFHIILNVTTVENLITYYSDVELLKIFSYEVAKFYTLNDVLHITVYEC